MYNVYTMYYTSAQSCNYLGISRSVFHRYVREGKIKDYAVTQEGKTKHYGQFAPAEIKQFKKDVLGTRKDSFKKLSEHPFVPDLLIHPSNRSTPVSNIPATLARIESKLDALLKLWS